MMRVIFAAGCSVSLLACVVDDSSTLDSEVNTERAQLIASTRASIATRGVTAIPDPPFVRQTLVDLGQALAFDKILSGNRELSCMTCHPPQFGSDDDRQLSLGVTGHGVAVARTGNFAAGEEGRNAPPVFNLHIMHELFWDGRVEQRPDGTFNTPAGSALTPEMAAVAEFGAISVLPLFPVTSRDEMRGYDNQNELAAIPDGHFAEIWAAEMARLGAIPQYRAMFEAAYPGQHFDDMTFAHAANAIGGFIVAKFAANHSPWDDFLRGKDDVLSTEELRGAEVFMRTCVNCHGGSNGSDQLFHNTALAQFGPGPRSGGSGPSGRDDFGRERVTGDPADRYKFRTTPLRNVQATGPFGHLGEIVELEAFVRHYSVRLEGKIPIGNPPGPAQNLREYDVTQIEDRLEPTLLDNTNDILANIDPLFRNGSPIQPDFVAPITAFMRANTDKDSLKRMQHVTPASVPSGLPVGD